MAIKYLVTKTVHEQLTKIGEIMKASFYNRQLQNLVERNNEETPAVELHITENQKTCEENIKAVRMKYFLKLKPKLQTVRNPRKQLSIFAAVK